ncbi:MAG: hypothetical protein H0W25_14380 [Acidimicrobiia bacterium]|nr:hypothetical protein [Acidimicrobiia bacterium]
MSLGIRAMSSGSAPGGNADIGGIGVHIGARVAAAASPSEVLASSTVRDLTVGSGLSFVDRGAHRLKGVPGEWRLYAAGE